MITHFGGTVGDVMIVVLFLLIVIEVLLAVIYNLLGVIKRMENERKALTGKAVIHAHQ